MSEIYWGHWRGMDAISRIAGTVMCMKKWCTTTVVALTPSNALDDCTTISSIPHPAMVRGTKPGESLQHARKPRSVFVPAMSSDARSPIGDVSEILDAMAWHCDGFRFKISRTQTLPFSCDHYDKAKCRQTWVGYATGTTYYCVCVCHAE